MQRSDDTVRQTAMVPEGYDVAASAIAGILQDIPPKIIAIDGMAGSGKTTLGRYLAWFFNVTLIETDLFIERNRGCLSYREDEITKVIEPRMMSERPVLVDGNVSLRLLGDLDFEPAFHLRVEGEEFDDTESIVALWTAYMAEFSACGEQSMVIKLPAFDNLEFGKKGL